MGDQNLKSKLLTALQKGETLAIRKIYEQAYPACANLVKQNSGTEEDAKDVFQEALLIFIKKLKQPDFRLTASVKTFMYAVVRNLWLKQLRKREKKGLVLIIDEPESNFQLAEEDLVAEKQKKEDQHIQIESAMEQIPKVCKKIIMGYYFHKMSLKELAIWLDYSDNFIKVKKKRCMDKLKDFVLTNSENKLSS